MDTRELTLNGKNYTNNDGDMVVVASSSAATTWSSRRRFVHPGSSQTGVPLKLFVNAWRTGGGGGHTFGVRLVRASDAAVIASIEAVNSTDDTLFYDLGVISNFPVSQDVLDIQVITSNTSTTAFCDSFKLYY